jgi:predicted porin
MGEWLLGLSTIGNPGPSGVGDTFGDPTGTYGLGGSVIYSLTPALSIGGGVAYIGATDADSPDWGEYVIEIDAGLTYRFNPNTTMNLFAGYMFGDQGDDAWGAAWRTNFSF